MSYITNIFFTIVILKLGVRYHTCEIPWKWFSVANGLACLLNWLEKMDFRRGRWGRVFSGCGVQRRLWIVWCSCWIWISLLSDRAWCCSYSVAGGSWINGESTKLSPMFILWDLGHLLSVQHLWKPCTLPVEADKLQMVHPIASVLLIPPLLPGSPATGLNLLPIC